MDSTRDTYISRSRLASEPQRLTIRVPPPLTLCNLCSRRFRRSTFTGRDGTFYPRCPSCRKRERCPRCRKIKKRRHVRRETELSLICDKCRQLERENERTIILHLVDIYPAGQRYEGMAQLCISEGFDAVSEDRSELVVTVVVNKPTKTAVAASEEKQLRIFNEEVVGTQFARPRLTVTCQGVAI